MKKIEKLNINFQDTSKTGLNVQAVQNKLGSHAKRYI